MGNLRMAVLESGRDYLAVSHHKSHGLNILIKSHLAPGLKAMVHLHDLETKAPTNSKAATDREILRKMKDLMKHDMINLLFTSSQDLLNIATGEKCHLMTYLKPNKEGFQR